MGHGDWGGAWKLGWGMGTKGGAWRVRGGAW